MSPYQVLRVVDRQGNVLEENHPEPHDAIRADTAYVMTTLLQGVTTRGTAATAAALDWPIAGKTGTMDEYTDAWFIGFDPDITIGVWLGYDEKKSLGNGETGATAALPIWIDVMKAYLAKRGRENPPSFQAPGNIVFVSVDKSTGAPSNGDDTITDAFIAGTQPEGAPAQRPSPSLRTAPSATYRNHLLQLSLAGFLRYSIPGFSLRSRRAIMSFARFSRVSGRFAFSSQVTTRLR